MNKKIILPIAIITLLLVGQVAFGATTYIRTDNQNLDDIIPDEMATIENSINFQNMWFSLTDISELQDIQKIKVYWRVLGSQPYDIRGMVKTGGATNNAWSIEYSGGEQPAGWITYSKEYALNFNTGNAWTWGELNNLEVGTWGDRYAITQIYVEITTPEAPPEEPVILTFIPISTNFVTSTLAYVNQGVSGLGPFLAFIIGLPLAFWVLWKVTFLVPKK